MEKIIVITGPTGVGKSALALQMAQKFRGELINADSRQIYKELTLGTSKPTPSEFKQVPHHLYDHCYLEDTWNAGRFCATASKIISDLTEQKKVPFIIGGTALYIKTLLFGLVPAPKVPAAVRQQLDDQQQTQGLSMLYEELKSVDPEIATRLHPNDALRIKRALEIWRVTQEPLSLSQKAHGFLEAQYDYLKIGLKRDRQELYHQLNERVLMMIQMGLEQEVRFLCEQYGEHPLLIRSIGYAEWIPYFKGECSFQQVIELIQQHTRNLAKRQLTWFKKEEDIEWYDWNDEQGISDRIGRFLQGVG